MLEPCGLYQQPYRARARFLPDRLLRLHDVPRTVSLVVLAALTVAAALLNAFATLPLLGLAAFLSGFSFGGFQVLSEECCCVLGHRACVRARVPGYSSSQAFSL